MRIVSFITQTSVIDQILTHLRTRTSREALAGVNLDAHRLQPEARIGDAKAL
jgi:hypothetical protein